MVHGEAYLIPLDGASPRALGGFKGMTGGVALSPDAHLAAVGGNPNAANSPDDAVIRVWNLETGEFQVLKSGGNTGFHGISFLPGERLVSSSNEGLLLWDLRTGKHETLSSRGHLSIGGLDSQGRHLVVDTPQGVTLWDLEQRTEKVIPIPSAGTQTLAISPDARFVVAGRVDGEVWVLPLDAAEPHVVLGHEGPVGALWISPESDRIYSAAQDGTVRIWDVPQGQPLHACPLPELLEVLRAQTNMRIALDSRATNGYRIDYVRFPGWKTTPAW
jgi:WD40 repeat protein